MAFSSISILIPCINEERFIEDCLRSILEGSYPLNKLEIFVIDGGSTDQTKEIVLRLKQEFSQIHLLDNKKKIVPAALNVGIEAASFDHVVWVGAHAVYDEKYLENLLACFQSEKVASVGGVIIPKGKNWFGHAVALATKTKFGIGNAKYRYATKRQTVDTVFGGCWLKSSIKKIGGFNENWVRNQDYELNTRLRKSIGPLMLDPSIKCYYFCRGSLRGLTKQYFQYGFWRFKTLMKHPSTLNFRILAPAILLVLLVTSLFTLPFSPIGMIVPLGYLVACVVVSLFISVSNKRLSSLLILPLIFPSIHLSWAVGFFTSAAKRLLKWK